MNVLPPYTVDCTVPTRLQHTHTAPGSVRLDLTMNFTGCLECIFGGGHAVRARRLMKVVYVATISCRWRMTWVIIALTCFSDACSTSATTEVDTRQRFCTFDASDTKSEWGIILYCIIYDGVNDLRIM